MKALLLSSGRGVRSKPDTYTATKKFVSAGNGSIRYYGCKHAACLNDAVLSTIEGMGDASRGRTRMASGKIASRSSPSYGWKEFNSGVLKCLLMEKSPVSS